MVLRGDYCQNAFNDVMEPGFNTAGVLSMMLRVHFMAIVNHHVTASNASKPPGSSLLEFPFSRLDHEILELRPAETWHPGSDIYSWTSHV